jgi:hypothetical protein
LLEAHTLAATPSRSNEQATFWAGIQSPNGSKSS